MVVLLTNSGGSIGWVAQAVDCRSPRRVHIEPASKMCLPMHLAYLSSYLAALLNACFNVLLSLFATKKNLQNTINLVLYTAKYGNTFWVIKKKQAKFQRAYANVRCLGQTICKYRTSRACADDDEVIMWPQLDGGDVSYSTVGVFDVGPAYKY